jgi:catechol 2,3-dioxygenase-like lactoylglutathione lyase family enzyme
MGADLDGIRFYWYRRPLARDRTRRRGKGGRRSSRRAGRVIDHIAFSVEGLDRALAQLEADGVTVVQRPKPAMNGLFRSAFVAAPDGVELEIVEAGK